MGSGKGSIYKKKILIFKGKLVLEVRNVDILYSFLALNICKKKLSFNNCLVKKF